MMCLFICLNMHIIFVRVSVVNGLAHVSVCWREANGLKAMIQMDMEAWSNLVVEKGVIDHLMGFSTSTEPKRLLTAQEAPKRRKVAEPICHSTPKVPHIDAQMPRVLNLTEPEDGGLTAMQFKWMPSSSDDIVLQEKGVWTFDEDFCHKSRRDGKGRIYFRREGYLSGSRGDPGNTRSGNARRLVKSCYAFLIYSEINRMAEVHCEGCQNRWDSQMDNVGFYDQMAPLYDRATLYYEDAEKAVNEKPWMTSIKRSLEN
jgi:hypothetical protein